MPGPVWLLGTRFCFYLETIAAKDKTFDRVKITCHLETSSGEYSNKSKTIKLFTRPSETLKENCTAVSVCSTVNCIALISLRPFPAFLSDITPLHFVDPVGIHGD